jgi:hypothetical protein
VECGPSQRLTAALTSGGPSAFTDPVDNTFKPPASSATRAWSWKPNWRGQQGLRLLGGLAYIDGRQNKTLNVARPMASAPGRDPPSTRESGRRVGPALRARLDRNRPVIHTGTLTWLANTDCRLEPNRRARGTAPKV